MIFATRGIVQNGAGGGGGGSSLPLSGGTITGDLAVNGESELGSVTLVPAPADWGAQVDISTYEGTTAGDSSITVETLTRYLYAPIAGSDCVVYLPESPTTGDTVRIEVENDNAATSAACKIYAQDIPTYTLVHTVAAGTTEKLIITWTGSAWSVSEFTTDAARIESGSPVEVISESLSITGDLSVGSSIDMPLGSPAAPSIRFGGATTSGLYASDNTRVGFSSLGVRVWATYSSGLYMEAGKALGINTSNWFRITANRVELGSATSGGTLKGLTVSDLEASAYIKTTATTFAGLIAAATAGAGARSFVTDSNTAASGNFGATFAGGGANFVPCYSDGTNWRIG